MKYICDVCGWVYDEDKGDPEFDLEPGVTFDELDEDFLCPLCGADKSAFIEED